MIQASSANAADFFNSLLEVQSEPEIVPAPEAEANVEPVQVDVEPQPARKPRRLVAAMFGRKR